MYCFYSNKSYGSHKNRAFKDESHKGSMDSLNGEEKKDASKEDLEQEEGKTIYLTLYRIIRKFRRNDRLSRIKKRLLTSNVSR